MFLKILEGGQLPGCPPGCGPEFSKINGNMLQDPVRSRRFVIVHAEASCWALTVFLVNIRIYKCFIWRDSKRRLGNLLFGKKGPEFVLKHCSFYGRHDNRHKIIS